VRLTSQCLTLVVRRLCITAMSRRAKLILVSAVSVVIACCMIWQARNSRVSGAVVDQKATEILKQVCALEMTDSWRTASASGGLVGSPFYSVRWWREYFILRDSDSAALVKLSDELAGRQSKVYTSFLGPGISSTIMPHRDSETLAPWWRPDTNNMPMHFFYSVGGEGCVVYLYGFTNDSSGMLYIHIIEGR